MLRVRVCVAHIVCVLGPKFSKQGSFFDKFSLNMGGFSRDWQRLSKIVVFRQNSPKNVYRQELMMYHFLFSKARNPYEIYS